LISQELEFEAIVKPDKNNVGPDHLLRIESGEVGGSLDDDFLNAQLFKVEVVPN